MHLNVCVCVWGGGGRIIKIDNAFFQMTGRLKIRNKTALKKTENLLEYCQSDRTEQCTAHKKES